MDGDERAGWLRLILTPDLPPRAARELLREFGLPGAIFGSGMTQARLARVAGEAAAPQLAADPPPATRSSIAATENWLASDPSHALVTLADPDYPPPLLELADPPLVLFARGRRALLRRPAIAIVGSRSATRQGEDNASAFAAHLARAGLTIVSGMARGIDAAAHRGALDTDAGTVAVLGTGIDVVYPPSNCALAQDIARDGLLLSELPLGTPALAHNFPRRNRLIAGLSLGVLVVEAALHSGSLITARLATEAGREVFALPGSIHSPLSRGCHRLIREGAKLVESARDVLEELRRAPAPSAQPDAATAPADDGSPRGSLLALLGRDPVDLDTLAARSGRPAGDVAAELLQLELAQDVERLPGNRYQRLR